MHQDRRPGTAYVYTVRPPEGDGLWVVEYQDIPGCFAQGESEAEAINNAKSALQRWLANASALGISAPSPASSRTATGSVRIRVPRTVHRQLTLLSKEVGLSFNETVSQLLFKGVARDFGQQVLSGFCLIGQNGRAVRSRKAVDKPVTEYAGNWLQRLPEPLHHQLVILAKSEGVSVNLLIAYQLVRELERWGDTAEPVNLAA